MITFGLVVPSNFSLNPESLWNDSGTIDFFLCCQVGESSNFCSRSSSSDFGGTQALGVLVSLTLMVAMFANLILLPSFLMSFEKAMLTRWFKEPFFTLLDEEEDLELDDLDFEKEENNTL